MLIRVSLAATFGVLMLSSAGATAPTTPSSSLSAPARIVLAQAQDQQAEDEDKDKQKSRRDRSKAKAEPSDKGKAEPQQVREPARRDGQQTGERDQRRQAAPPAEERSRRDRPSVTQDTQPQDQSDRKAAPRRLGSEPEKAPRVQELSKHAAPVKSKDEEQAKRREDARKRGIGLPGDPGKADTATKTQPQADDEKARRREDARTKGIGVPGESGKAETAAKTQPQEDDEKTRRREDARTKGIGVPGEPGKADTATKTLPKSDDERARRREDARTKGIGLPADKRGPDTAIQVQPKPDEKSGDDARRIERSERRFRRDDPRVREQVQEQAKEREQEKTPAQELARTQVEPGKEVKIDGGARTLAREGDRVVIRSDDTRRLRWRGGGDERVERLSGDLTRTVIIRPDGTQIITVTNARGEIVRRYRRDRHGREIVIIEDVRRPPLVQINLPPLVVNVPRERYIVDTRRASRRDLEMALWAPPVEPVERAYSLYEIRHYDRIRDKMPRVDLLTITFDTDSALISPDQVGGLEHIASIMLDLIERDPGEAFLVEGHTDGTGSRLHNLALSDRRAEAVAFALTEYFDVPPENLVTQGYGPDYPKIPTAGPERENRRVAIRRIGPLMAGR